MPRPGKKTAGSPDEWLLNGTDDRNSTDGNGAGGDGGRAQDTPAVPIGEETAQWVVDSEGKLSAVEKVAAEPTEREDDQGHDDSPATEPDPPVEAMPPALLAEKESENRELAKRIHDLQTDLQVQEKNAKGELSKALEEREADFKSRSEAAEAKAKEQLDRATGELVKKHDSREERLTKTFEKQRAELTKGFEEEKSRLTERIDELESELATAKKAAAKKKSARTRKPTRKSGELDLNQATFEELRNLSLSVTQSARVIAYRDVRGGFDSLDELDDIPGLPKETRTDLRKRLTLSS